ncbi:hypothetical protein [Akkermansia sp.]
MDRPPVLNAQRVHYRGFHHATGRPTFHGRFKGVAFAATREPYYAQLAG